MISIPVQTEIARTKSTPVETEVGTVHSFILAGYLCEAIAHSRGAKEPNMIAMVGVIHHLAKKKGLVSPMDLATFIHKRYEFQIGILPVARLMSALKG